MTDKTINENLASSQGSPIANSNSTMVNTSSKPLEQSVKNTTPLSFLDNQQNPVKPLSFLDSVVVPKQDPKKIGSTYDGNIYDNLYKESTLDLSNRDFLTGGEDIFNRDLDIVRGERQGAGVQLAKGVGRVAVKVGSEVAKIPGYGVGAVMSIFSDNEEGVLNTIFNNDLVKGVNALEGSINDSMLAVYNSEKTQRGDGFENFLNNVTSTSFWATEGADGIGFLLSMMIPGAALSKLGVANKLVGMSAKGLKAINKSMTKYDAMRALISKGITSSNVNVGITTLANTLIEAGAEASGAMNNMEEKERDILSKKLEEGQTKLMTDLIEGRITEDEYANASDELFNNIESDFKKQKGQLGSNIFNANLAILLGPNLLQSKMLYGGLAKSSNFTKVKPKSIKEGAKAFATGFASEGFWEEGAQTTVENYYSDKAENLELKGLVEDTSLNGLLEEYLNTLTTSDGMKAIFLGGMLGGPMSAYHGIKNAKSNYKRSLMMTSLVDSNITNFKALNTALYQTDKDDNYILDEEGKPIIDPVNALGSLDNIAKSSIFTNYLALLYAENQNNIDASSKEAYDLVQTAYLQSVASGIVTVDPDGSLTMDALTEQFKSAEKEIKENEEMSDVQKNANIEILKNNQKVLEKAVLDAKIENETFNTLSEVIDFNSLDFEKANALNRDKLKEAFIQDIKPKFINNQLQIKLLEGLKSKLEDKIDNVRKTFKNDTTVVKKLNEKLEDVEEELQKREHERDSYFGDIEGMQRRLDEKVIPAVNENIERLARADKLSGLIKSITEANTTKELDEIKNDEPLIEDEFKKALTARRKEIEEEESKLKKETAGENNKRLEEESVTPGRKPHYDAIDALFPNLGDIPIGFKNKLIDAFESNPVYNTLEEYVNDENNFESISELWESFEEQVETEEVKEGEHVKKNEEIKDEKNEEIKEVEETSSKSETKTETLSFNHVNPNLKEVVQHNIYDVIDFKGERYILIDQYEDGSFLAKSLDKPGKTRNISGEERFLTYDETVEILDDNGYSYHRLNGVIYTEEFNVIPESDSSYETLVAVFNNDPDIFYARPEFVKPTENPIPSGKPKENANEEVSEQAEEELLPTEEVDTVDTEADGKFEESPTNTENKINEIPTTEKEKPKEEDVNIEQDVNNSKATDDKNNINQSSDEMTFQTHDTVNFEEDPFNNPRVMTYGTNFKEWLDLYENREGVELKVSVSDRVNDLGQRTTGILDSYYKTGNISEEDKMFLLYHLPLKVEVEENGKTYTAYLDAFKEDVHNGVVPGTYNANSAMQAMPMRFSIINNLLSSRGKPTTVKIVSQLNGSIQLSENNANSSIVKLKEFEGMSENDIIKYILNNFLYTNNVETKNAKGSSHNKRLGASGDIFLMMSDSKGNEFPLKVNQGKFNIDISNSLSKFIIGLLSNGTSIFKTKLKDVVNAMDPSTYSAIEGQLKPYFDIAYKNYGEDVKVVKFLNILVNGSKSDKNKFNFKPGVFEFGTSFYKANRHIASELNVYFLNTRSGVILGSELTSPEAKDVFSKAMFNYLNYLNRNIKVDLLKDPNYIKELLKSGAITTNINTQNKIFGTPRIFLDGNVKVENSPVINENTIKNSVILDDLTKNKILRSYASVENNAPTQVNNIKKEEVKQNISNTVAGLTEHSTAKKKEVVKKVEDRVNLEIVNKIEEIKEMKPRPKIKLYNELSKSLGLSVKEGVVNVKNVDSMLETLITENENSKVLKTALEKLC